MFLLKLWIFEISFSTILSFLFGILFGIALIGLIYAIIVVASIGDKKYFLKTEDDSLTEAEAKDLIYEAQRAYKDKKLRGKTGRVAHCYSLSKDLAYGIASRFYPKSKYPLLEITVDEAILLLGYIEKRLDEILGKRGIRLIRKMKISFIADVSRKTSSVVNSRAFNVGVDVTKSVGKVHKILSIINPVNWGKRLAFDTVMPKILDKLCLVVITVVGEETFKIYSKKVLNKEVNIETNIDEITSAIDNDFIDFKNNTVTDEKINEEYKYLSRYYSVMSDKAKYESLFDSNMKMKMGGN